MMLLSKILIRCVRDIIWCFNVCVLKIGKKYFYDSPCSSFLRIAKERKRNEYHHNIMIITIIMLLWIPLTVGLSWAQDNTQVIYTIYVKKPLDDIAYINHLKSYIMNSGLKLQYYHFRNLNTNKKTIQEYASSQKSDGLKISIEPNEPNKETNIVINLFVNKNGKIFKDLTVNIYSDWPLVDKSIENQIVEFIKILMSARMNVDSEKIHIFRFNTKMNNDSELKYFCDYFTDSLAKEMNTVLYNQNLNKKYLVISTKIDCNLVDLDRFSSINVLDYKIMGILSRYANNLSLDLKICIKDKIIEDKICEKFDVRNGSISKGIAEKIIEKWKPVTEGGQ